MQRDVVYLDAQTLPGSDAGRYPSFAATGGLLSISIAPVAMMLPTLIGPLLMVVGEASRDQSHGR